MKLCVRPGAADKVGGSRSFYESYHPGILLFVRFKQSSTFSCLQSLKDERNKVWVNFFDCHMGQPGPFAQCDSVHTRQNHTKPYDGNLTMSTWVLRTLFPTYITYPFIMAKWNDTVLWTNSAMGFISSLPLKSWGSLVERKEWFH